MGKPLITIITVCRNAASDIERTMLSVLNQTYKNIEYIIIDGGSTDGTVDIIRKYADRLAYWVSEPDNGIYDAMNKGGSKAVGEWLQFLNSGDVLSNRFVIENVFEERDLQSVGVVYGNMIEHRPSGFYLTTPSSLDNFSFDFPIFHPCTFVRTDIFKAHLFDLSLELAADFEFLRKLYYAHVPFHYVPIAIVCYDAIGGVSAVSPVNCFKERTKILGVGKSKAWKLKRYIMLLLLRAKLLALKIIDFVSPSVGGSLRKMRLEKNPHYRKIVAYSQDCSLRY